MFVQHEESDSISHFRTWFCANGGRINDTLTFSPNSSGLAVYTRQNLDSGTLVSACPFSLAVTLESTRPAIQEFCHLSSDEQARLSPRQRICTYLALHHIIGEVEDEKRLLSHRPYLRILPQVQQLLTPLFFSEIELGMFKGTNMYGATIDQRKTYWDEFQQLCEVISRATPPKISGAFTFEMYQITATYLSSRAFPSTLLLKNPSLVVTPSSYPVLLPGLDVFNHRRGQPVSWSTASTDSTHSSELSVGLIIETPVAEGEEVFNNYGPKPNSSLILGYGFVLPDNPDDTIMLKVGSRFGRSLGGRKKGHEVGRNAAGADAVWNDVREIIASEHQNNDDLESEGNGNVNDTARETQLDIETAGTLSGMVTSLIERLPDLKVEHAQASVREEVRVMWRYYVQGQKDILEALLEWLEGKDREAVRRAEELGISIVDYEADEDE